jgi:hypothetical protein
MASRGDAEKLIGKLTPNFYEAEEGRARAWAALIRAYEGIVRFAWDSADIPFGAIEPKMKALDRAKARILGGERDGE